jgi:RNA polymerase primary sigma factor
MAEARSVAIEASLARLRPREARVVRLHYGFDAKPMTLERIAAVLGVTRERVRQIRQKAHSRLRDTLPTASLAPFA